MQEAIRSLVKRAIDFLLPFQVGEPVGYPSNVVWPLVGGSSVDPASRLVKARTEFKAYADIRVERES
jgi:hypothetical protein